MNKAQLIETLASKLGSTKTEASNTLDAVISTIIEGTLAGECVIPGLGKLKLTDVKESSGVAMGKKWTKPAHKKVKLALSAEGRTLGN